MSTHVAVNALRTLLVAALIVITAVQIVGLPWLSGVVASDLPNAAHMRWPILTLAILGLVCVQVGIICTLRLLGFARSGEVFSSRAFGWVDAIIGAFVAGSLICVATIVYQSAVAAAPPGWMLMLLAGAVTGLGFALLMTVMRTLLVRATTLKNEMDVVI